MFVRHLERLVGNNSCLHWERGFHAKVDGGREQRVLEAKFSARNVKVNRRCLLSPTGISAHARGVPNCKPIAPFHLGQSLGTISLDIVEQLVLDIRKEKK